MVEKGSRAGTPQSIMYANGTGVEKDKKKALEWWQEAANNGFNLAKYNIEMFEKYDETYGTEKDPRITVDFEALNSK